MNVRDRSAIDALQRAWEQQIATSPRHIWKPVFALIYRRWGDYLTPCRRVTARQMDRLVRLPNTAQGETALALRLSGGPYAFAALPMVGGGGRVIFTDQSRHWLDRCRSLIESPWKEQAEYRVIKGPRDFRSLSSDLAEVILVQWLAAWVSNAPAQCERDLRGLYRVLKPNGRFVSHEVSAIEEMRDLRTAIRNAGFENIQTELAREDGVPGAASVSDASTFIWAVKTRKPGM